MKASDCLKGGAETFAQRNALYGDNYLVFGKVMAAMFPDGIVLADVQQINRYGVLAQCVAKLTRYCAQFRAGGHMDSAHDLMVYAAMLQELTAPPPAEVPQHSRKPAVNPAAINLSDKEFVSLFSGIEEPLLEQALVRLDTSREHNLKLQDRIEALEGRILELETNNGAFR